MMNLFKNSDGKVYDFSDIEVSLGASNGMEALTDADIIAHNNPIKTFDQELDSLNSKYDSDFSDLVSEYNRAVARDGVTESVKVDTVRSKMTTLDSEYDDAFMSLLIKYS